MAVCLFASLAGQAQAQATEGYAADMKAGRTAYQANDFATAQRHFDAAQKAAENDRQKSSAVYALGVVAQKQNKLPEAKQHAEQALALNPADKQAKGLLDEVNAAQPAAKGKGKATAPPKGLAKTPLAPPNKKTAKTPAAGNEAAAAGTAAPAPTDPAAAPKAAAKPKATDPKTAAPAKAAKAAKPATAKPEGAPAAQPGDTPPLPPTAPPAPRAKSGALAPVAPPGAAAPLLRAAGTVTPPVPPEPAPGLAASGPAQSSQSETAQAPSAQAQFAQVQSAQVQSAVTQAGAPVAPASAIAAAPPARAPLVTGSLPAVPAPTDIAIPASTGAVDVPASAAFAVPLPATKPVTPRPLPAKARFVEMTCGADYRADGKQFARAFEVTRSGTPGGTEPGDVVLPGGGEGGGEIVAFDLACEKSGSGAFVPRKLIVPKRGGEIVRTQLRQTPEGDWDFAAQADHRPVRIRIDAETLTLLPAAAEVAVLRKKLAENPAQLETMAPDIRQKFEQTIAGEGYPEFRLVRAADGLDAVFDQAAKSAMRRRSAAATSAGDAGARGQQSAHNRVR